jgi:COMPASS component SWD2
MDPLEVTHDVVRSMDIGKVFKDHEAEVNSVTFSDDCNFLATAGDDDRVNIYNVERGSREKMLKNTENGVSNLRFTHHEQALLCSTKSGREHLIKYWSIYDNKIIHNFGGHNDLINSIEVSPKTDMFLSTARDKHMLIWDLRLRRCLGRCEYRDGSGPGIVSFDPSGAIFSLVYPVLQAGETKNYIKLFDTRNFSAGAFNTWEINCPEIKKIQFSDDGNYLLASTSENKIFVLDSLEGSVRVKLQDFQNETGKVSAIFSADSRYVLTGCEKSNGVVVFDVTSGSKVHEFRGHPKVPLCLAWSRKHVLLVSACQNVLFWVPDLAKLRRPT